VRTEHPAPLAVALSPRARPTALTAVLPAAHPPRVRGVRQGAVAGARWCRGAVNGGGEQGRTDDRCRRGWPLWVGGGVRKTFNDNQKSRSVDCDHCQVDGHRHFRYRWGKGIVSFLELCVPHHVSFLLTPPLLTATNQVDERLRAITAPAVDWRTAVGRQAAVAGLAVGVSRVAGVGLGGSASTPDLVVAVVPLLPRRVKGGVQRHLGGAVQAGFKSG